MDWLILPCWRPQVGLLRDAVLRDVCRSFEVRRRDLLGRYQSDRLILARRSAWRQLRALGWSFGRIGRVFSRSPWTVRQACLTDALPGRRASSYSQMPKKLVVVPANALRGRKPRQYLGDASTMEGSV